MTIHPRNRTNTVIMELSREGMTLCLKHHTSNTQGRNLCLVLVYLPAVNRFPVSPAKLAVITQELSASIHQPTRTNCQYTITSCQYTRTNCQYTGIECQSQNQRPICIGTFLTCQTVNRLPEEPMKIISATPDNQ